MHGFCGVAPATHALFLLASDAEHDAQEHSGIPATVRSVALVHPTHLAMHAVVSAGTSGTAAVQNGYVLNPFAHMLQLSPPKFGRHVEQFLPDHLFLQTHTHDAPSLVT